MSYKKNRRDEASFRGVSFYIDSSNIKTGRRYQNHEYLQRDKNYPEDLGLATRLKNLNVFVVGDDYDKKRDRLLEALEQGDYGQLVHPWMGTFDVTVGEAEVIENRAEAGIARFSITFIPYFPQSFPTASINTGQILSLARSLLAGTVLESFVDVISNISTGLVNVRAMIQGVNSAFDIVQSIMSDAVETIGSVADFVDEILNMPEKFASTVEAYLAQTENILDRFSSNGSSYSNSLGAIGGYITQTTQLYDKSVLAGSETEVATNAINQLVEQLLIINIGDEVAAMPVAPATPDFNSSPDVDQQTINPVERPDVPVADDVIAIRNQILDVIWSASNRVTAEQYQVLNNYRQKITEHLNAVAESGVRLETIKPMTTTSSLVLAYRRFGDATRHKEIEQRNRIKHRSFIYPQALQVARVTNGNR